MRTIFSGVLLVVALAFTAVGGGCGPQSNKPVSDGHGHEEHGHEDEHEGPHGGHVIELGRNHEYHAELVENEPSQSVTVYMLDKEMKELAIAATSLTMNLIVDGAAKTFELAPADAQAGKASRFDSTDAGLFEALHEHEASGKLNVTIDGTPHSGAVEHHHDEEHDEHGHGEEHKD